MRLLAALLLAAAGTVGLASPASAATGNILPPFDVGQTWNICQGYNNPGVTHTGTSAYGLDLTGSGCGNSASGRNVRAPMNGTVAYYQASYGNLCINVSNNRSVTLTHINSSKTSGTVSAGQWVGTVAAPYTRGNNGVSHIHFQMWSSPGCYNGSGVPFDSAHNARICGAPNLTSSGPNGGNGTWSGTSFKGQECGSSNTGGSWGGVGNAQYFGSATMTQGQVLGSNKYLMSDDGRFVYHMQSDGNFVMYGPGRKDYWESDTPNHPGAYLKLQTDGNAVIYDDGVAIWESDTNNIATLKMQNDGNLVGRSSGGTPVWETDTVQ